MEQANIGADLKMFEMIATFVKILGLSDDQLLADSKHSIQLVQQMSEHDSTII